MRCRILRNQWLTVARSLAVEWPQVILSASNRFEIEAVAKISGAKGFLNVLHYDHGRTSGVFLVVIQRIRTVIKLLRKCIQGKILIIKPERLILRGIGGVQNRNFCCAQFRVNGSAGPSRLRLPVVLHHTQSQDATSSACSQVLVADLPRFLGYHCLLRFDGPERAGASLSFHNESTLSSSRANRSLMYLKSGATSSLRVFSRSRTEPLRFAHAAPIPNTNTTSGTIESTLSPRALNAKIPTLQFVEFRN